MLRCFCAVFLFASLAGAQVTFVSPEEARKALQSARPSSSKPGAPAARRANLLPNQFAGWKAASLRKFGPFNAATLAGADAPVLLEYEYQQGEQRQYTNGSRQLTVNAFRMKDASGSYGLFTYYRAEDWESSGITGGQAATRGDQALLRKEEVLVRASGARLSHAELAALAGDLATAGGGLLPSLPRYLPDRGLVPRSGKYLMGPETLSRVMPGLPAGLVDFDLAPELEVAQYRAPGQPPMKLLLINYPTSQIAASKMKLIEKDSIVSQNQQFFARRTGPLLALVFGSATRSEAGPLLNQVNYSADVVWNEQVAKNDIAKFREFLITVFVLTGAWLVFAVAAGLLFGLVRVLVNKWYPNQVFDRPEETEVIQLHINY